MPHHTHLPPLRASPFHLRLACSPSPPPRLSPPRWPTPFRARALASGESIRPSGSASNLDALLSAAELLCLAPPAICSAVCAVRLIVKPSAALATGRMLVMQYLLLVGAVAIGALVRRKQWERLCQPSASASATGDVDLVGRLDKVEESVRGVVAAVVALSRTVEKLGVRFRVLRRTLRDPISETATLAQKNSKATQILAVQENLLEKEIGSIQKVLYAMQEQQEKQLELILAIGEASRILDDKQGLLDQETARSSSSAPEYANIEAETLTGGNNKPDLVCRTEARSVITHKPPRAKLVFLRDTTTSLEQQEKQIELILAIGEASRILDDKKGLLDQETARSSSSAPEYANIEAETLTGGNNKADLICPTEARSQKRHKPPSKVFNHPNKKEE